MEFKLHEKYEQMFITSDHVTFINTTKYSETNKTLPKIPSHLEFIYNKGVTGRKDFIKAVSNDIKKFLMDNYNIENPVKCTLNSNLVKDSNAIRFTLDTQEITVEEYNG